MSTPQNVVINRMRTSAKQLMEAHYEEVRLAHARGKLVAWGYARRPVEMLEAMDIVEVHTGGSNARITSAKLSDVLIREAEAEGYSEDICSYAKINIGMALFLKRKKMDTIPEHLRIPEPDLHLAVNSCPIYTNWAYAVGEITGAPVFVLQVPFMHAKERRFEWCLAYVEEQLWDLVRLLEKLTGRPFDWDKLKKILWNIKRASQLQRDIQELCKTTPAVRSIADAIGVYGAIDTSAVKCRPEAVELLEEFKQEVQERITQGIPSVPNEEIRLGWKGVFPWYVLGHLSRLFASNAAVVVGTAQYGGYYYGWSSREILPPDGIDPEQPIKTLAAKAITEGLTATFDERYKGEVIDWNEGFKCDGLVFHAARTCRPHSYWTYDFAERSEKELGIPAIIIEGDHTDGKFYSKAQVDTRLEAFIESLKARKQACPPDCRMTGKCD